MLRATSLSLSPTLLMDALSALRAEIEKKKKARLKNTTSSADNAIRKRWLTKAEIEREREAAYLAAEKEEAERLAERRKRKFGSDSISDGSSQAQPLGQAEALAKKSKTYEEQQDKRNAVLKAASERSGAPPLSKREVYKRLRAAKQPVTLFGETEWDRFDRLRNIELTREEGTEGQRNIFQKKLREMEAKDAEEELYHYAGAKLPHLDAKKTDPNDLDNSQLDELDEPKCREDFVHCIIRRYMRLWKSEIDAMTPEQRKTMKGRSSGATYEQTREWLRPLEKLLRKRRLSRNILDALKAILESSEEREYIRANTLYLERLAIGNAPWPMGATMVGIHARAAREKIGEDKIAHVMNDEQTRKYIQAVKRLLTVAQRHFPTSHSKMIL